MDYDSKSCEQIENFYLKGAVGSLVLSEGYFHSTKTRYEVEQRSDKPMVLKQRNCASNYYRSMRRVDRTHGGLGGKPDVSVDRCIDDDLIVQCIRQMRFLKKPPPARKVGLNHQMNPSEEKCGVLSWGWRSSDESKVEAKLTVPPSTTVRTFFGNKCLESGVHCWKILPSKASGQVGIARDRWGGSSKMLERLGYCVELESGLKYRYLESDGRSIEYQLGKDWVKLGAFKPNEFIGVRCDMEKKTLEFFKDGASIGITHTHIDGPVRPSITVFPSKEEQTFALETFDPLY